MVADNSPPATAEPSPMVESETKETTTPRVQMRAKTNGAAAKPPVNTTNEQQANETTINSAALNALERAMGTLHETSPETEDNNEEIRRLDNQLDHLNEYINKVEERLNAHNAKLRETLKQQREDREKRRQSFHERLETNRQEDDEFQKQLNALLNQITLSRSSGKQSAE
ncbi:hypothetical protein M3Y98_00864900 [Aphelenchoides besseyi]|nr:hypothetical protein M3Y98_00864900 [Aphelenchoides besseyi]KAI6211218.1 hypothetical protein M3Y96_00410600 [Aphelenchoides besseyi]